MHKKLALLLLPLLLAACSKLTPENYNRIQMGMSYAQVQAIIGDPTSCSDLVAVRTCTWGDEKRFISVNFVADKVILMNSHNLSNSLK